jgi:hypothetical protein
MMVDPGPLRTDMRATAVPGEDPMSLREPTELTPHLVAMASVDWQDSGKLFDFTGPTPRICDFGKPVEAN